MLDSTTKRKIDTARDILVGKVPDPKSQIEQITLALIYKFMNYTDKESVKIGGKASYFVGDYERFSWDNIIDPRLTGQERMNLYTEGLERMGRNPKLPELFRNIFKNAFLPFRSPETLNMFLEEIDGFQYDDSEKLGDAYEYLLSIMSSQGDAGQFRTPRHIIDFIVNVVDPLKEDTILDPACGTAGFIISAIKHIRHHNTKDITGDLLDIEDKKRLADNVVGYDISPDMVRISLVNMFLHNISEPHIYEYDTLSSQVRWDEDFTCILANPPFMSPKGSINPHERFGIKSTRSEVLFVDYIMEHLTIDGKAGVIVPEGIIFQSQNAFQNLRKKMLEDCFLWAVVSLPSGVFNPYSGVKTSILFFDRHIARNTDKVLFVKIDADGYGLGAQRKPTEMNDLPEAYNNLLYFKEHYQELPPEERTNQTGNVYLAHTATKTDIKTQDYILSANRYLIPEVRTGKWPRVKLGEVLDYEQPTKYIVSSTDYDDSCEIPVLTAGKTFILGYTNETEGVFKDNLPVIMFDDFTTATKLVDFPFKVKSSAMKLLHARKDKADVKFIYYIMQNIDFQSNEHKRYWISQYSEIPIPLPPLEVQKEIVAEIESYQKIIDGAKQVIANWNPKIDIDPDWQMVKLGDVVEINPESGEPEDLFGDSHFVYIDISSVENQSGKVSFQNIIHPKDAPSRARRIVRLKDTLLSTVRPNLKAFAFLDDLPEKVLASTGFAVLRAKEGIIPKYIYLFSLSDFVVEQLIGYMGKGAYPSVNTNDLKLINIPLPPLPIQQQIASRIEAEQTYIDSCKKFIEIYQSKIQDRINKVWEE